MKRIRAIVEIVALWLAITLALAVAVLIVLPATPPYAAQAGHVVSGHVRDNT